MRIALVKLSTIGLLMVLGLLIQPTAACTIDSPTDTILTSVNLLEDHDNVVELNFKNSNNLIKQVAYFDITTGELIDNGDFGVSPNTAKVEKIPYQFSNYSLITDFNAGDDQVNVTLEFDNEILLNTSIDLQQDELQETPVYFVSEKLSLLYLQMNGGWLYNISTSEFIDEIQPLEELFTITLERSPVQVAINEEYQILEASSDAECLEVVYIYYDENGLHKIANYTTGQSKIFDHRNDILLMYQTMSVENMQNQYYLVWIDLIAGEVYHTTFSETDLPTGTPINEISEEKPVVGGSAASISVVPGIVAILSSAIILIKKRESIREDNQR